MPADLSVVLFRVEQHYINYFISAKKDLKQQQRLLIGSTSLQVLVHF